jgi:hypothetical protein
MYRNLIDLPDENLFGDPATDREHEHEHGNADCEDAQRTRNEAPVGL